MNKLGWWAALATFGLMAVALGISLTISTATAQSVEESGAIAKKQVHPYTGLIAVAIAAVTGTACLGAGYAVGKVGSAALGAASENPELLGRSLIFVGLAEGIAIYGLIVAIMLLGYLTA